MIDDKGMRIRITKRAEGAGVLHCKRADGSETWQRREKYAEFFSLHDMTHYAVETRFGYRQGFFGLIDLERASGIFAQPEDAPELHLSEESLNRARQLRGQLFTRWRAVPAGQWLELEFPGTAAATGA